MTVNPYTLNSLYNQGIIDCIPYDICMPMPATQSGIMEMGLGTIGANQNYNTQMGSQYLDMAKKGDMYDYYGNSTDSFVHSYGANTKQQENSSGIKQMFGIRNGIGREYNVANAAYGLNNGVGSEVDYERMANDKDGQDFRQSITNAASKAKESVLNSNSIGKGLLATLGIVATLILVIKGCKKPKASATQIQSSSFWSKLNPINWFKK